MENRTTEQFRLPLRISSSSSRLSKKTHDPEKVLKELIDFFRNTRCVVFLKHVETIRIMKWNEGDSQPTVLYETQVKNVSSKLRQLRSAVVMHHFDQYPRRSILNPCRNDKQIK